MIWAIVWLVAFVAFLGAILTPPHKLSGWPCTVIFLAQFTAGLDLAIRVLT